MNAFARSLSRLWLWVLVIGLAYVQPGWAAEHIVSRAYLEDMSGQQTLSQIQDQVLQPFDDVLTKGYGKGVIWIKIRIDPSRSQTAADKDLFVRIRPNYLDDLQIFDEAEGFQARRPIGDRHPLASQDETATFYLFKIKAGQAPRDLWLRLQSTSTRFAYLEVLDEPTLRQSNNQILTFGGIYLALMGIFAGLGFWQGLSRRDALNWSFTFYQVMAIFYGASLLGYLRLWTAPWLSPIFLDRMFSLVAVLFVFSVLVYSFFLLNELGHRRIRIAVFYSLSAVFATALGLQFFGHIELSLKINILISLAMPVLFLLDALTLQQPDQEKDSTMSLSKRSVVVYFSLTFSFGYFVALPAIGWVTAVEFTLYSTLVYSLSSGLFMLGMLQYRANVMLRQRENLVLDARTANQRAELERMQRLERERLLAMLGHELKTPLATLSMMLGDKAMPVQAAQKLKAPLQEINEVIDRTVQTGQLERNAIGLQPVHCQLLDTLKQPLDHLTALDRLHWLTSSDTQDLTVEVDPFLLSTVVRNLLDNALKYSPDGTPIDVIVHADMSKSGWSMEVRNPVGRAGFPDPDRVFEKFWRSPRASYRSGSGQGLFIAWRLAQLMGGQLHYVPDKDCVSFRLELPMQMPKTKEAST